MSDNMTPAQGNGPLSVDGAAVAMLGLMGGEDSKEQPTTEPEVQAEATEAAEEESYEPTGEDDYESEAEDDNAEEAQEKPKYRVKAAGEEREVTLDDLIRGYQLEADYTKKTQSLAEERKAVEAERSRIQEANQLRDAYAQRLQMVEQLLSQQPQDNLEALKETDPIGYAVKVAEQQQKEKQLYTIQAERQRIAQQQQAEQAELLTRHVASEAEKLAQVIPEFTDKEKGEPVRKEIRAFAKSIGWTDQELASVYDSRAVLTLYKAMQYDRLMQNKPQVAKKVSEAPKMLKPGSSTQRSADQDGIKKQKQKLRSTGRVADAANLFERFL
jgi:hypothetical protein